jgi:hypothetical protein
MSDPVINTLSSAVACTRLPAGGGVGEKLHCLPPPLPHTRTHSLSVALGQQQQALEVQGQDLSPAQTTGATAQLTLPCAEVTRAGLPGLYVLESV